MPGTSGHKLDTIVLGRCELMSITACKAGTGKGLCLWVGHYPATDSSPVSLFPISPLIAPWITSTLQSPTHLLHILRQASETISTPLIMCPVHVKLNRKNMEFSFPWVHSPERSPMGVPVGIIMIEFSVIASLCAFPQYLVFCKWIRNTSGFNKRSNTLLYLPHHNLFLK